ncbi:MAG: hypothetical protein J0M04_24725 [Verrucomicrobia bacterium]|nr:hypothetical protein [Verrucomicrobiota bacterium]
MSTEKEGQFRRRGFLGGALVAAGAAAGWVVTRVIGPQDRVNRTAAKLDDRFTYDISEFEETEPNLLIFEPAGDFPATVDQAKRVAFWDGQGIVVSGENSVAIHGAEGTMLKQWRLAETPYCLLPLDKDSLLVGYADHYAILDADGKERFKSPNLGHRTYLTSAAVYQDRLYFADAGNREVLVCKRESGEVVNRFGKKDADLGNPGFNIPSPYFALAVAADGKLRIANTGLLRVETYSLDGRFVSSWGAPGMKVDRFCGCCNPAYFTLTPAGDFITSEKGLARINVYAADGSFKGAVAGPNMLVTDKQLAKRACTDCTVGAGFDVTLDANGDVLTLDPYRKVVRRFRSKNLS